MFRSERAGLQARCGFHDKICSLSASGDGAMKWLSVGGQAGLLVLAMSAAQAAVIDPAGIEARALSMAERSKYGPCSWRRSWAVSMYVSRPCLIHLGQG